MSADKSAKPPRSPQEIQQEYQNLCLKAGDLQYKIVQSQKDLSLVNDAIRELNFEYATAVNLQQKVAEQVKAEKEKAEKEKAAAEAVAKPEETTDNVTELPTKSKKKAKSDEQKEGS
jgi:hypothetical protein